MSYPKILSKYDNENLTYNLAFRVEHNDDLRGGYGRVVIRPVYTYQTPQGEARLGYFDDTSWDGSAMLGHFEIRCLYTLHNDGDYVKARQPFAYQVGYIESSFTVEKLESVEVRTKFLRWLNGRIEKVQESTGLIMRDEYMSFGKFAKIILRQIAGGDFTLVRQQTSAYGYDRIYSDIETYVNKLVAGESVYV